MKIKIFQIDAFADQLFTGNPAAVCLLESWIEDSLMQSIAAENNLAETAFVVPNGTEFEIRWFTPEVEVDLCGHATLAAGFTLMNHGGIEQREIRFRSPISGRLSVRAEGERYILNFPADTLSPMEPAKALIEAVGMRPAFSLQGKSDALLVFDTEAKIKTMAPDFRGLMDVDHRGVIVTAPGDECDFVSRFFAPQVGIDEDPVTGSAHTTLTPYWSNRLGKDELVARQLSRRGGNLVCRQLGDRVEIGGTAITYLIGEIVI